MAGQRSNSALHLVLQDCNLLEYEQLLLEEGASDRPFARPVAAVGHCAIFLWFNQNYGETVVDVYNYTVAR